MRNVGDYIVFRKDVCEIVDIKENPFNHVMSYTLIPITDKSLKMNIPIDNASIRDLMTMDELNTLIQEIRDIPVIEVEDKQLEHEYKRLLNEGTNYDLVQIIKTTYLRNQKRLENNKKISDKDHRYFEMAENYLYNEVAKVLNIDVESAKNYIIEHVNS